MKLEFRIEAGEYERFIPGCFDKSIGKATVVNHRNSKILDAVIIEDGKAAIITVDIIEDIPTLRIPREGLSLHRE